MFDQVGFNTYVIELLARQIPTSDYSIDTLADKVSDGLYGLNGSERVISNKDGRIIKKNIPDIIHILFDLANLNEYQKQALRNLYVLRFLNINKNTYLDLYWALPRNMDIVNDLVEIGWVQYQAERRAFEMNCIISIRFLAGLNLNIESNYFLASQWLISLIENPDINLPDMSTITPLLSKLNKVSRSSASFENKYINFSFWLYEFAVIYLYDDEQRSKKRLERVNINIYKSA